MLYRTKMAVAKELTEIGEIERNEKSNLKQAMELYL